MKIKQNMTHLWYDNQIRRPLSKRERKMDSSNLERSFDSLVDLLPQFHSALSMCKFVERRALRNHTFSRLCLLSGNHMYLSLHDVILGVDKFYFIFQFSANYSFFCNNFRYRISTPKKFFLAFWPFSGQLKSDLFAIYKQLFSRAEIYFM